MIIGRILGIFKKHTFVKVSNFGKDFYNIFSTFRLF